jgi:hypothetical protein
MESEKNIVLSEERFLALKEAVNLLNLTCPLLNKRHKYVCENISKISKYGYFTSYDISTEYNGYGMSNINYVLGTLRHDSCYGSRIDWDDISGKRWDILTKYPLCWLYISEDELLSQIATGIELAKFNKRNKRLSNKSDKALKRKRVEDLKEKALSKLTPDEKEALLGKQPRVVKSRR